MNQPKIFLLPIVFLIYLNLTGCVPIASAAPQVGTPPEASVIPLTSAPAVTPFATRPTYNPGELVDYVAQTGDTIPALAVRFNTTVEEIYVANDFIPRDATTMPPGMPMKIPIYYLPLWGSSYQIIPDEQFVNGPAVIGFDTQAFVDAQPGWLRTASFYAGGKQRTGAETVDYVALNFSISPRVLLAILEYQTGALTEVVPPSNVASDFLGNPDLKNPGFYLQLVSAADKMNIGFYSWRTGAMTKFDRKDGSLERPDPWQNAASVALQYYFSDLFSSGAYEVAISPTGFAAVYVDLFGDPWAARAPHIPGSLTQPEFRLPFEPGKIWTLTGGPHSGWGTGFPLAALDLAPPTNSSGCFKSDEWTTAVAGGVIARTDVGISVLDLDGDGDERTGWVIFHLHLATRGKAPVGTVLEVGDKVGHPSCEGGSSTGSHTHMARKYNGEWVPAAGTLAFNMEGWIPVDGSRPYLGTLVRNSNVVTACDCSNQNSQIWSDLQKPR